MATALPIRSAQNTGAPTKAVTTPMGSIAVRSRESTIGTRIQETQPPARDADKDRVAVPTKRMWVGSPAPTKPIAPPPYIHRRTRRRCRNQQQRTRPPEWPNAALSCKEGSNHGLCTDGDQVRIIAASSALTHRAQRYAHSSKAEHERVPVPPFRIVIISRQA